MYNGKFSIEFNANEHIYLSCVCVCVCVWECVCVLVLWACSIWPMDMTLLDVTTPGQSGHGNNGNEEVLCIPQSSSITGPSPSDCLVSYLGQSLEES